MKKLKIKKNSAIKICRKCNALARNLRPLFLLKICCQYFCLLILILAFYSQAGYAVDHSIIGAPIKASGNIPAYEGAKGLKSPTDITEGDSLYNPNNWPIDEKPLFRIDHKNVDKYIDRLSQGQIARLKKFTNIYMSIYPTHRNNEFPKKFYELTKKNIKTCFLDKNNILQGFNGGVPFPNPKNGLEAIWNIKRQTSFEDLVVESCTRIVSPSGRISKKKSIIKLLTYGKSRLFNPIPNPEDIFRKVLIHYTYPATEAGLAVLNISYLDDNRETKTWLYLPTIRRVRRSSTAVEGMQLDGESTIDDKGTDFNGKVNDWTWKLLGKKEMYVPANCYKLWQIGTPDKEECHTGGINPALPRYELHRVWVIEGTLKKDVNHPYSRRICYCDEDSWSSVVGDKYDRRGNLWRLSEYYTFQDVSMKMMMIYGRIYLNLESGRYELIGGAMDENSKMPLINTGLKPSEFTVQKLKRNGR